MGRSMPGESVSICQVPPARRSLRHSPPSANRTGRRARPLIFVLRLHTRGRPPLTTERCQEKSWPAPPTYSGGAGGGMTICGGGGGSGRKKSGGGGSGGVGGWGGGGGMMNVKTWISLKLLKEECCPTVKETWRIASFPSGTPA